MDYDDSKIDDDLDKLLQHIKEEQQNSLVKELKTRVCMHSVKPIAFC
jgi:mediator of RNA polymerase II transcription subunit 12